MGNKLLHIKIKLLLAVVMGNKLLHECTCSGRQTYGAAQVRYKYKPLIGRASGRVRSQ